MNLAEIRQEAWDLAGETGTSDKVRLWKTPEMNRYINRVYRATARETKCIRDSITASICQISCTPPADLAALTTLAASSTLYAKDLVWYNDSTSMLYHKLVAPYLYALSPLIIDIDECKFKTNDWKLTPVSVAKWRSNVRWEETPFPPVEYSTDLQSGYLALYGRMETADTLMLSVRRMPLSDMTNDTDEPEFKSSYHDLMINGILHYMYKKQDSETVDEKKAADYRALWMLDIDNIKKQEDRLYERLRPNYSMSAFR